MMARSGTRRTSGSRGRSGGRTGTGRNGRVPNPWGIEVFTRPEHNRFALLVGLVLRYRAELTVITIGWTVFVVVSHHLPAGLPFGLTSAQGAGIVMAATVMVVVAVPASRRFTFARCWAVMTRHRMRACFYQTRTWTTNGRMPFLLWVRPSPVGERVRVWLPAGLSVNHLERIDDELAAACWAREVRITPSRRQAALAVVDIIRHDPLDTTRPLRPPVVDHVTAHGDDPLASFRPAWLPTPDEIDAALPAASPAVTSPAAPAPTGSAATTSAATTGTAMNGTRTTGAKPTRATTTGASAAAESPGVTGFGGEDVSDYI